VAAMREVVAKIRETDPAIVPVNLLQERGNFMAGASRHLECPANESLLLVVNERSATEKTKLHAYGTNIEGEWDEVFAAIKRCHEVVHAMGTPRISSTLRFGTRIDRPQSMDDKVRSVEEKLAAGRLNVD
jgi:uncharacterized protein (TIGR00106 family)